MARVTKNEEDWHILTIKGDHGGEVVLVGPGKRSYISAHATAGFLSISGAQTLRALAKAILKHIPADRRTVNGSVLP